MILCGRIRINNSERTECEVNEPSVRYLNWFWFRHCHCRGEIRTMKFHKAWYNFELFIANRSFILSFSRFHSSLCLCFLAEKFFVSIVFPFSLPVYRYSILFTLFSPHFFLTVILAIDSCLIKLRISFYLSPLRAENVANLRAHTSTFTLSKIKNCPTIIIMGLLSDRRIENNYK